MFQLYFYPYINAENDIDGFQSKLINEFDADFLYDITYSSKSQSPQRFSSQILSFDSKSLNYFKFDHLNELPTYMATFWKKQTKGTGPMRQFQAKVKPKIFFKQKRVDSYTQETYYVLNFEPIAKVDKSKNHESLKDYTNNNMPTEELSSSAQNNIVNLSILDKVNFHTSLDLHIEMLVSEPQKMNSHEKLQYQIFKAKEYLEEAIMLGVERVYLLHGVGKGRLKDELAIMLKSHRDVAGFKNEYHGQFGFGATEVYLK